MISLTNYGKPSQAGRETSGALVQGQRDETTARQVSMWRAELDEALERTPKNIERALKWLETNQE